MDFLVDKIKMYNLVQFIEVIAFLIFTNQTLWFTIYYNRRENNVKNKNDLLLLNNVLINLIEFISQSSNNVVSHLNEILCGLVNLVYLVSDWSVRVHISLSVKVDLDYFRSSMLCRE